MNKVYIHHDCEELLMETEGSTDHDNGDAVQKIQTKDHFFSLTDRARKSEKIAREENRLCE